jgi:hypothetical protein
MRTMLKRHIPLDTIARWWYVLVAGALLGLIFSQVTGFTPFSKILSVLVVEGSPSGVQAVRKMVDYPGWKDDLLFSVLGFLLGCAVIWLLEEVRAYLQHSRQL